MVYAGILEKQQRARREAEKEAERQRQLAAELAKASQLAAELAKASQTEQAGAIRLQALQRGRAARAQVKELKRVWRGASTRAALNSAGISAQRNKQERLPEDDKEGGAKGGSENDAGGQGDRDQRERQKEIAAARVLRDFATRRDYERRIAIDRLAALQLKFDAALRRSVERVSAQERVAEVRKDAQKHRARELEEEEQPLKAGGQAAAAAATGTAGSNLQLCASCNTLPKRAVSSCALPEERSLQAAKLLLPPPPELAADAPQRSAIHAAIEKAQARLATHSALLRLSKQGVYWARKLVRQEYIRRATNAAFTEASAERFAWLEAEAAVLRKVQQFCTEKLAATGPGPEHKCRKQWLSEQLSALCRQLITLDTEQEFMLDAERMRLERSLDHAETERVALAELLSSYAMDAALESERAGADAAARAAAPDSARRVVCLSWCRVLKDRQQLVRESLQARIVAALEKEARVVAA
ncbi:hypothetical protein JKP88DRAFT_279987 [Tribonema minus]|uniref:Uncharacterized protein n=1 Tax=Tribonema minus TaxID=303371 RepID=A0A835YSW9_9STRA|nr:hypothetical protein JKP88DRAFT_279987 [Tribonema minus]